MSDNINAPFDQKMRESESESLKRDLFRYLKFWKWIVLGGVIALGVSYFYLRYEPNVYSTNAKIKILKKKDSGLDLSGLTGTAPMFDMSTINLENEMEILLSRRIIGQVVDNLSLTTYYYTSGRIKTDEIFGSEVPFKVDWLISDDNDLSDIKNKIFIFKQINNESFNLKIVEESYNENFNFGQEIKIAGSQFVIYNNPVYDTRKNNEKREIYFNHINKQSLTNRLKGQINVQPSEGSEVLEIKIAGKSIERNEAILNNLIKVFNDDGVEDDRKIAKRTSEFVAERLDKLESELDTVETNLVEFRSNSNFISESSGSTLFSTYSDAEKRRADLETQLEISRFIQSDLKDNSEFSLVPGGEVGLQNSSTNNLIADYNKIVIERNRILTSSTENSPQILELSKQLRMLTNNIKESINNYITTLQISLQNMSNRERQFNSNIKAIPEKEKITREIQRQQAVKENLLIFLLQKEVEADLSAAITAPVAKVVDFAYTSSSPISPKRSVVYLAGLVIGLAIPIAILYLIYLFDTKVTSKEQIQAKLDIPIIAEIPVNKQYDNKIVDATDNSNVAEAFRILRTNMNYLNNELEEGECKVIFSTSSTKGEGKTFTAINSASVFASNNSKTLLIGSDLRNPQLHNYLGVSKKNIGLSSYLVDAELTMNDVIFKTEKDINFDIILSGEIPPNPSELLNNGRLEDLIAEARKIYDYVIIDTAPTMLVTDTLTIIDQADAIIYMVRANFTELKILRHIKDLSKFNMKKNVGIAINAVDEKKGYEYNYGYGYGYNTETKVKKWYNKI